MPIAVSAEMTAVESEAARQAVWPPSAANDCCSTGRTGDIDPEEPLALSSSMAASCPKRKVAIKDEGRPLSDCRYLPPEAEFTMRGIKQSVAHLATLRHR